MLNQTVIVGKLLGKFQLPYKNISAIEIDCGGSEWTIHMSESMWEQIPIEEGSLIAVKGHLYRVDGQVSIMADKITILEG